MTTKSDYKEDLSTLKAQFSTTLGAFTVELYADKAPEAVWNFVNLAEGRQENPAKSGPFYDGIIFHRVIPGFMVQAGCPEGRGTGGPDYEFKNEDHPDLSHDGEGILAMANRGPDTNGSQFYITLAAASHLDGGYTVFGKVTEGIDIIQKIGGVKTDRSAGDRPYEDVVINTVKIIR